MSKWDSTRVRFEWGADVEDWNGVYVVADSITTLRHKVEVDDYVDAIFDVDDKDYPFMSNGTSYRFCYLLDTHALTWDYESFIKTFGYNAVWLHREKGDRLVVHVKEDGIVISAAYFSWAELATHADWVFRCSVTGKEYNMRRDEK